MRISRYKGSPVSGFFVFMLLGVFAAFCMFIMLLGVRAYDSARTSARETGEYRILTGSIRSLIRSEDGFADLSVRTEEGVQVLVLDEPYWDTHYLYRVYVWDGWLRESFTDGEMPFDPELGDRLCPALEMDARLDDRLLTVRLRDARGSWNEVSMALYAARSGKE